MQRHVFLRYPFPAKQGCEDPLHSAQILCASQEGRNALHQIPEAFCGKTPFCGCKLCFKLNTTLGSILDAKLPVVEWRRLSRYPFKMTLVHACPLLSFEKISFLLKSCSWLFWYCLFLVGRGALRGIMLRHLLCKTISVRNMFASDFSSLHLAASYLDLLWVMIGSFDCLARVWWW